MIRDLRERRLFIGDAISARNLKLIYEYEFDAVVDLAANEPPAVLGRDVIYCRFPLSDDGSNGEALLAVAIECVCNLIDREMTTLVACSAGMSRSPLVAAAALSIDTGESFQNTLMRITATYPADVSPTLCNSVQPVVTQISNRRQTNR